MLGLAERKVACPYCAELIVVLIDTSMAEQQYIEDCQVCCSPIEFTVQVHSEEAIDLWLRQENE
ncbi:CPXCG motif-containing cysteine-rich protein [Parahaliea sp. F7430]|uniref:CPXCG motif-containing cysteine-rich protein n=2 Tax=Sediminihaliea albiluteola TaxID=2758564 RepID=A0A7W2TXH7_9GAMM|nr:CPXCG motif-containing cysteine-rich protein [Sediminihaliea albiluteola]MBA6413732.1 CPXCG motif-containing cysteine-rich protein [Sediminihaliea albiluteola]